MSQPPVNRKINADALAELLKRAREDAGFRDELLTSPKATLEQKQYLAEGKWVKFFGSMSAENFAKKIENQLRTDPTGEDLAEGTV